MKKIITTLCLFIYAITAYSQTVVLQRTSDLMPELYQIQGQAVLEELTDGTTILRLTDNFATPPGPDVRILLSNTLSLNGAEEIINLSTIGHFNGANTFEVPSNININDFNRILFFCVVFNQFWASGSFSAAIDPNAGSFVCEESSVSISDGSTAIDICPTDDVNDEISFANSIQSLSSNYAYLITDENDVLQEVVSGGSSFDFEGSTSATQRVHGLHFDGTLEPIIGVNRMQTTASGCFTHSGASGFVTIAKTGTCVTAFLCEESLTATTNWATTADVCPTDNADDIVELRNNLFIPPGDHYAYLITDADEIVQAVVFDSLFNFEGSTTEEQRVYGIHYDGMLQPAFGQNRLATAASGCFIHSGGNLFLTVNKTGECENTTSTNDPVLSNAIDIFPNPSDRLFSIKYNDVSVEKVQLLDSSGKLVQEYSNINQFEILTSGIYFVRFITEDSSATKRIFVN